MMTTTHDKLQRLREAIQSEQNKHHGYDWEAFHQRERLRADLDAALKAALKVWVSQSQAHLIPESFQVSVAENTGFKGGDSGHGGKLAIRFETESGSNSIAFVPRDYAEDGYEGSVTLTARGDWEQQGLIASLSVLLLNLLPSSDSPDEKAVA